MSPMIPLIAPFRLLGIAFFLATLFLLMACSSTADSGAPSVGTPIGRAPTSAGSVAGPVSGGGMPGSAGVAPSTGSGGPR